MDLWNISSRAVTAGLVALVTLDVVLVGAALRSTHQSGIDTSPLSSPSASLNATGDPLAPPTPSKPATGTATAAPLQTMLAAVDNQRAWRVGAGSCAAGGAT